MSYEYCVVKYKVKDGVNSNSYQQVMELDPTGFFLTWSITELRTQEGVFFYGVSIESFKRTRKWLQENHPELML